MRNVSTGVVAVTGASSGVGRATAQAFAREGATVGLIARGREALAATAAEVRSLGGQPVVLECDVADPRALEAAAGELEERHGEIEVWVNNAMASVFAPTWEITAEEFRRVTEVTYLGVVYGTLCALSRMRPRDRGVIVQVGSALAYRGIPLQSPYCACKHAIQGFTESLRCELMHEGSGVRVTMVQMPALEHAAVRHGAHPPAPASAAGAADLPAGGRSQGDRDGRTAAGAARVVGRRLHSADAARQRARAGLRRPLPGTDGV